MGELYAEIASQFWNYPGLAGDKRTHKRDMDHCSQQNAYNVWSNTTKTSEANNTNFSILHLSIVIFSCVDNIFAYLMLWKLQKCYGSYRRPQTNVRLSWESNLWCSFRAFKRMASHRKRWPYWLNLSHHINVQHYASKLHNTAYCHPVYAILLMVELLSQKPSHILPLFTMNRFEPLCVHSLGGRRMGHKQHLGKACGHWTNQLSWENLVSYINTIWAMYFVAMQAMNNLLQCIR